MTQTFTVLVYSWRELSFEERWRKEKPYSRHPAITVGGLNRSAAAELVGTIMSSGLYGKVELVQE